MASQGTTSTSRLSQIQMRFQQKQLQVREQRKIEMTAPKTITSDIIESEPTLALNNVKSNTTKNLNSTIGNGKVRQMFNERRRGAGIDRSNPLKPITSRSSSSSSTVTTTSISSKTNVVRKLDQTTTRRLTAIRNNSNGNDSVDYMGNDNALETYRVNEDDLNSETFPEQQLDNFDIVLPSKLEALMLDSFGEDTNNNHQMPEIKTRLNSSIKLNPVLTKKSPPVAVSKTPAKPTRSTLNATSKSSLNLNSTQKLASTTPKASTVKSSTKMAKPLASPKVISLRVPRAKTPPTQPPGTAACKLCNRFFNEDRLAKHQEVCEKMAMKKRKIFDASKHRVKGTEAEKYLKKPLRGAKTVAKNSSTTSTTANSTDASTKKSNWRKKHEEFIAAIRAAKEVQAHLAKGGKLSDLPPPPPSENPDYIACPHCSRRFNEAAANRHIPKCANMLHNKPKPAAKRR
ncbi:zinc finger C2HC domain-containing protein 1C isoform X2 [Episyrphus balteatus]|uniref:zinc finger C2HC domain-containing protein 1C isoform X2 n=1 Tax=Episyrphus balteatus TaxID=286459 RepID=UPI002484F6D0|nr:zinc finger C2HC domain-containing protein 1C isoform X2 [Episyrphus balteatus]XP_055850786.1 zinc finger C2HC domain-containing protein 1C isoform X2 [Episyrphus balteatus]